MTNTSHRSDHWTSTSRSASFRMSLSRICAYQLLKERQRMIEHRRLAKVSLLGTRSAVKWLIQTPPSRGSSPLLRTYRVQPIRVSSRPRSSTKYPRSTWMGSLSLPTVRNNRWVLSSQARIALKRLWSIKIKTKQGRFSHQWTQVWKQTA